MPDLPTLSINNTVVFQRLVAAFGDAEQYRIWLRGALRNEVMRRELESVEVENRQRLEDKRAEQTTNLTF